MRQPPGIFLESGRQSGNLNNYSVNGGDIPTGDLLNPVIGTILIHESVQYSDTETGLVVVTQVDWTLKLCRVVDLKAPSCA